jgi:ubiquinone/menaquinone biosynthesis C-methylase UbiE
MFPPSFLRAIGLRQAKAASEGAQDLDIYWDPKMAELLETWGEGNVWHEIDFFLANRDGKVLDIACGTGKTIEQLSRFSGLEIHGCDISDMLINKAVERGVEKSRLKVCDMTESNYSDGFFDFAYSIGALEHFTEDGIEKFFSQCRRIIKDSSFHMIPVSRSGEDSGWITTQQSYYNNSDQWWLKKFEASFEKVVVLDSLWNDKISVGKWFVCS